MAISVQLAANGRVDAVLEFEYPLNATAVWGQMRHMAEFATHDPFHASVAIAGGRPVAGAEIRIVHGLGPFCFARVGRILRWREGVGYAFSDLSRRGTKVGFPHVYSYEVKQFAPGACRFRLAVRGRWTASWLPRIVVRAWLAWVLSRASVLLQFALLRIAPAEHRNQGRSSGQSRVSTRITH